MNLRRSLLLLLLAGLGLAGTAARAAPEEGPDFHSCLLEAAGGQRSANAQCTELAVPLDPSRAGGPRIKLHLARLPSRAGKPEPDPLFFVAGGPGESASDGYLAEQGAFDAVLARRDIYLLDQRGTGGSHPLDCTMPAGQPVPAHLADWTRQCLAGFDVDPRFFTTTVAVEDLDRVRRRLGLQRINLYGVSYGTRVVLAYLRAHPEHVRAVVLDGVVPADRVLGPEIALNAQKAFDAMLDRCRGDSACAAAFPDLDAVFAKLLARLRSQPERVQLRDPTTGKPVTTTFTAAQLASAVRLLSYSTETVSLLPLLIWRAGQENDPAPLVAQARWVDAQVRGSLSLGMHNAVVCSEDAPRYPPGGSGAL
ncbi:MAG: alpha/beta fold hydrolase, partial [Gammaproteobacteria bacterium]